MANSIEHNHPAAEEFTPSGNRETNDKSGKFASRHNLQPTFDINCFDHCFEYLTKNRRYFDKFGDSDQVYYGDRSNLTNCYLAESNKKNDQFKTDSVESLGKFSSTTVKGGLTYRIYTDVNPNDIRIGGKIEQTTLRLESIPIKDVKVDLINGSKLSYLDATLLELYRERVGEQSLLGTCERKNERNKTSLEGRLKNLSLEK